MRRLLSMVTLVTLMGSTAQAQTACGDCNMDGNQSVVDALQGALFAAGILGISGERDQCGTQVALFTVDGNRGRETSKRAAPFIPVDVRDVACVGSLQRLSEFAPGPATNRTFELISNFSLDLGSIGVQRQSGDLLDRLRDQRSRKCVEARGGKLCLGGTQ